MKLSKQKASLLTAVLLLLSLSITTITVDAAKVRTYPNV
ncbi:TPA: DNAse, partial [Streptococcus pyogenes]|nr:DNAse [Streptococcus pyogenes]